MPFSRSVSRSVVQPFIQSVVQVVQSVSHPFSQPESDWMKQLMDNLVQAANPECQYEVHSRGRGPREPRRCRVVLARGD